MILAVDIGNSNIVLGAFKDQKLKFVSRMATDKHKMEDQYAIDMKDILLLYGYGQDAFEGAIISSVVPALLPILKRAVAKCLHCEKVLTVSPGVKTGLNIKIDNPAILGSDLVAAAVAALEKYKKPSIIFDLGTATTISAIDRCGNFLGGSIFPGVGLSIEALAAKTAQLPHISVESADKVIGTNSEDSIKSGIVFGTASMMEGMIDRYREVLGEDAIVIATGGRAEDIATHVRREIIIDRDLLLEGLLMIYEKNAK